MRATREAVACITGTANSALAAGRMYACSIPQTGPIFDDISPVCYWVMLILFLYDLHVLVTAEVTPLLFFKGQFFEGQYNVVKNEPFD